MENEKDLISIKFINELFSIKGEKGLMNFCENVRLGALRDFLIFVYKDSGLPYREEMFDILTKREMALFDKE